MLRHLDSALPKQSGNLTAAFHYDRAPPVITYTHSISNLNESDLSGFLAHWDFNPPAGTLFRMLHQSTEVIPARDAESSTVCGYISALSDGVACAYISALEVRPEYQHQGIGTSLLNQMVERLDVFGVYLSCAPTVVPFYEAAGFTQGVSMSRRKHLR